MNPASSDEQRLESLQQSRQALEKEFENRRARIKENLRSVRKRISDRERKRDTRRKILIGKAILIDIEYNPQLKEWFYSDFPSYLTNQRDRALFDFPPLDSTAPAASSPSTTTAALRFPWLRNLSCTMKSAICRFTKPSR